MRCPGVVTQGPYKKPLILWARKISGEKKHEEVRRFANRDFRVRWIGSGKDELLAHLRPFPDLH
jgi:hypothetical protein